MASKTLGLGRYLRPESFTSPREIAKQLQKTMAENPWLTVKQLAKAAHRSEEWVRKHLAMKV